MDFKTSASWRPDVVSGSVLRGMLIPALVSSALFLSCTRDAGAPASLAASGDVPVRFVASMGEYSGGLKGAGEMTAALLDTFGVYAAYVPEGDVSGELDWRYMRNVPYHRLPSGAGYDTAEDCFWPVSGGLTFFAVSPYDSGMTVRTEPEGSGVPVYPTFRWTPERNPAAQVDLCVAVNSGAVRAVEVPLEFRHATSQIYFAANYVSLEDWQFIVVDSISIMNVTGSREVTVKPEPPYVDWSKDVSEPETASYCLSRSGGHLNGEPLPLASDSPRGVEITTDDGHMFLIPQSFMDLSGNVEVKVAYTLYYENIESHLPVDTLRHVRMESAMPRMEWEPDRRYRYVLTIDDKTESLAIKMHVDYNVRPANFYAMTNSMSLPEASSVVGSSTFELTSTVGPKSLISGRKEVEWEVEDYLSESNRTENEYISLSNNDYDDTEGTNRVKITCKKVTTSPVKITARTKIADNEEDRLEAYCMFSVTPAGVGLGPLIIDPEYTGW